MTTTPKAILENKVSNADLSVTSFTESTAAQLSEALKANTSINMLNLSLCDMQDDDFDLISEALQARKTKLIELNIDSTHMTAKSIPSIKKLIESGKIMRLLMFKMEGIHEHADKILELKAFAQKHNVLISLDHPRQRKASGFFETSAEGPKDPSTLPDTKARKIIKLR